MVTLVSVIKKRPGRNPKMSEEPLAQADINIIQDCTLIMLELN